MQQAGIEEFEWCHSHGGKVPRQQHLDWNGQKFRFDDRQRRPLCKCFPGIGGSIAGASLAQF